MFFRLMKINELTFVLFAHLLLVLGFVCFRQKTVKSEIFVMFLVMLPSENSINYILSPIFNTNVLRVFGIPHKRFACHSPVHPKNLFEQHLVKMSE